MGCFSHSALVPIPLRSRPALQEVKTRFQEPLICQSWPTFIAIQRGMPWAFGGHSVGIRWAFEGIRIKIRAFRFFGYQECVKTHYVLYSCAQGKRPRVPLRRNQWKIVILPKLQKPRCPHLPSLCVLEFYRAVSSRILRGKAFCPAFDSFLPSGRGRGKERLRRQQEASSYNTLKVEVASYNMPKGDSRLGSRRVCPAP